MRQIAAITIIVLSITACSFWMDPDPQLLTTDSYPTATPTPTLLPQAYGVQIEATTVPIVYPTPTPSLDTTFDPEVTTWFQLPDWFWFPLFVP